MNLVIDIGNTSAKMGLFLSGELRAHAVFPKTGISEVRDFIALHGSPENVMLATVVQPDEELERFLSGNFFFLKLSHTTPLPFRNLYQTPETLGSDRLAAAAGANSLFPSQNALAIDCGTCIKYDFVNAQNEYMGGNISPGLDMRFKALNSFTARLPLVSKSADAELFGTNTEQAIRLGVQQGALEEVKGIITRFSACFPALKTVLTGGDSSFFEIELKNIIFADPFLTLRGLNVILNHNRNT